MNTFKLQNRDGKPIVDWRTWTRPKEDYQWRTGGSAMELARAWFTASTPACPPEVQRLFGSHALTNGIELIEGRPELVTALPERGEGRNHDLVLYGRRGKAPVLITVEAKVDEPFGDLIGDYWNLAGRSKWKFRGHHT